MEDGTGGHTVNTHQNRKAFSTCGSMIQAVRIKVETRKLVLRQISIAGPFWKKIARGRMPDAGPFKYTRRIPGP